MSDKIYDLLEKMYIEFTEFRNETNERLSNVDNRLLEVDNRLLEVDNRLFKVEQRLDKNEINQESINDKISEAFEAISSLAEINEKQHCEIMRELKGKINVVELAVKEIAK